MAEHQPITVMCNAVRLLALGDPALAGLGHNTTYWALLSLAWAAGTTLVFATLAGILYRRTSPVNSASSADVDANADFLQDAVVSGRGVLEPPALHHPAKGDDSSRS